MSVESNLFEIRDYICRFTVFLCILFIGMYSVALQLHRSGNWGGWICIIAASRLRWEGRNDCYRPGLLHQIQIFVFAETDPHLFVIHVNSCLGLCCFDWLCKILSKCPFLLQLSCSIVFDRFLSMFLDVFGSNLFMVVFASTLGSWMCFWIGWRKLIGWIWCTSPSVEIGRSRKSIACRWKAPTHIFPWWI